MCIGRIPRQSLSPPPTTNTTTNHSTCFTASRLNSTTFQIVQDDEYAEMPFIYAKIFPENSTLVLIDTGCGESARDTSIELKSLRTFIETVPVADNNDCPLNPRGELTYLVILTHCHYDHICGIEQFASTTGCKVWASNYDKDYLSPSRLPQSSLCERVGAKTPQFNVTNWSSDGENVVDNDGRDLKLTIYHTPGHTPDEVAIWDSQERVLFVGDSMYQSAPIFFFEDKSVIRYSESLSKMKHLVERFNSEGEKRATISCGHITRSIDAISLLSEIDTFLYRVVTKQVSPTDSSDDSAAHEVIYIASDERTTYSREDGGLEFQSPERYFDEFRANKAAMKAIRDRQGGQNVDCAAASTAIQ